MRAGVGRRVVAVVAAVLAFAAFTFPVAAQTPGPAPGPTTPDSKTVRIPFPRDDGSLTPYSFQLGYPLLNLVYDTLLWRDATGVAKPWLARDVEINPQATQFTLRLTPGVLWHDGKPLTAEDVRFTFDYIAGRPSPRFTAEVAQVKSVAVTNAETVVITTKQSSPGFPDQTLADLPILPAHLWQKVPNDQTPPGLAVGSGPYRLVERIEGGGYRFAANPGYFKGPPTSAQIDVPIMSELDSILRAFRSRDVDMVPLRLAPNELQAVEGPTSIVARGASYWGVQLVFNLRKAPFNDPAVRQAVAKAIDLERLARTVADAEPADQGMLHPESAWAPGDRIKVTDVEGAKAALAGLAGQSLEVLSTDNDPVHRESARQVALALERAGLKASSTERPVAEMNRALGVDGGEPTFGLAVTTLGPASSYDPDYLTRLFGSGTATTSGYSSPEFDEAARRVATTVDPVARKAAVAEELRLLAKDLPALPLLFPNGAFPFHPAAHNGWQYVRGIGVLDKQSFLPIAAGVQPATTTTVLPTPPGGPPAITPAPESSGGGIPLGLVALGLAATALALIVVGVLRVRG